jgi:hypothetical protein
LKYLLNYPHEAEWAPFQTHYCSEHVRFKVFTAVTMKNAVFWDTKLSSDLTGDTLLLCYRAQPVNAM